MAIALKAENVSIRYITGDFKDIGLKEYTVRKLTRNYHVKEFMAVDGVSFELEQGDMLGIIGSNGAGKSTLLKAVAGIMEPTRGKITTQGEVAALLELGSGFDGDLTVKENAYLRGAMLGYTKEFMDQTYDQIIDFAELRDFEDRPFKQLSSGMKSRLAFSIASLVKPDILILDEVLSVGDGAFQEKSAKKMREIIGQGATTILVSHSLSQIRELCNKVLWLDHGKQVAFGETEEICDQYEKFLRGECPAEMEETDSEKDGLKQKMAEFQTEEKKDEIVAQSVHEKHNRNSNEKKHTFGRRFRNILPWFLVFLYVGLFSCLFLQEKYLESNRKVVITAQAGSGTVTFRGAQIDGNWCTPQDVVTSSDGWNLMEEENVLTDIEGNPLVLNLPIGVERLLIFDVGPNEGVANVSVGTKTMEFNLKNGEPVDYGWSFWLPYVRFSNKIKLGILALCAVAVLTMIMVVALYIERKHSNVTVVPATKNPAIEFLRFFFMMAVTIHHLSSVHSPAGYLTVDFFFILSGFWLMRYYEKDSTENKKPALAAVQYTEKRYFRLLPNYLFAFFLGLGISVCMWYGGASIRMIGDNLWELLMMESFGITENLMVGPGWYCSAMLIAGFCIYCLLAKNKEVYTCVIAPISFFVIFAWMSQRFGNLNRWTQFDTLICTGTLRGFAEIGLGCISYQIYILLRKKNTGNKAVNTIFELSCFSFIAYVIFKVGPSKLDFVCVLLMAALIISLFLERSLWFRILDNRLSRFLGSISIGIYLNHLMLWKVRWDDLVCIHFGFSWPATLMLYLCTITVFSALSTRFVEMVVRIYKSGKTGNV